MMRLRWVWATILAVALVLGATACTPPAEDSGSGDQAADETTTDDQPSDDATDELGIPRAPDEVGAQHDYGKGV
jgi:hypothetical protein